MSRRGGRWVNWKENILMKLINFDLEGVEVDCIAEEPIIRALFKFSSGVIGLVQGENPDSHLYKGA